MNNNSSPSELELLNAITGVLSCCTTEEDPHVLFNVLLVTFLKLTASEYGFIGEVTYADDGAPYIRNYATTNISWSSNTRKLYQDMEKKA